MMIEIYTGLTIGLVGSLHCVGMCGPIAVALPLGKRSFADRAFGGLLYNLGRTITYGAMGAVFGFLGKGIELAGFQQWASILLGVVMIMSVFFPYFFKGQFNPDKLGQGITLKLIGKLRKMFGNHSKKNLLIIGLLNGLLPCGLVYVAIAGAINTNDVLTGVLFMIAFGLGTIPLLLAVSLAGDFIGSALKKKLNRIIPVFIVILGIIFILRGMSLGIPFISPKSEKLTTEKELSVSGACCSKGDTKNIE
jgi:sulfite exporter TauE/SafE